MKIAVAKELYRSGVFREAQLLKNPNGTGWVLELKRSQTHFVNKTEFLSNDKGEIRIFKGIEAGLNVAEAIGFDGITVCRKPPVIHN